jgi:uncharacterized protein
MTEFFPILAAIGYILIFLGLVGTVVPVLPGPLFIWAGIFIWSWGDGFIRIGWPMLLFFGVLTLMAWGGNLALTTLSSRRAGTSWRSILISILGGIAGALLLSIIPVIGTLAGALLGSLAALWYMEFQGKGDREAATRSVRAYVGGFLLSIVLELSIALIMITIFAYRAFW